MKFCPTSKTIISICTLVCVVALSACAAPAKRDPYAGADQVAEIDPTQLVGNWKITVLNPIGNENDQTMTTTYNNDGTWTSTVIPSPEQDADIGPMRFAGGGSWQVNGDSLFAQTETVEETTGHKLGGLMEATMKVFIKKMSGSVNAYEMSENRMVFVNAETGQATLLERI